MARRVVLFDLGGALFGPGLQHILGSCEREWGLPRNFLGDLLFSGGSQSSFSRALRGEITLSQLVAEVDGGCRRRAASLGIAVPGAFSAARPFQDLQDQGGVDVRMLRAAGILRGNGFRSCVLASTWLDDGSGRSATAALLLRLRSRFDLVLESCRIGMCPPDPGIYSYALEALQARPQEAILLDDHAENLAAARDLGIATIPVRDPDSVLRELQELSGVQLLGQEEPLPIPCDPAGVAHGYVSIRPGVQLHFVELGQGPVLCLCHGFPESWLSWRFQIPALADAGFRVIALEMKGYGESTAPPDIPEYSQEQICKDFVTFLDKLGIPQVVLVGHDWGGAVAWNVALFYPERLRAVASLNTPYRPADPGVDIMEKLESFPAFDYQLYFQEPVRIPGGFFFPVFGGSGGSGAGEGHREDAEDPDPLLAAGGSASLRPRLPQGPGERGAPGGIPGKPPREPPPAPRPAGILHPAIPEIRVQGSPELVSEPGSQLELGPERQGQEDRDPGADGDGREGSGAAARPQRGHGILDPAAAPGAPPGLRPLDPTGEAGRAEPAPPGMAAEAPPGSGFSREFQALIGNFRPREFPSPPPFPGFAPFLEEFSAPLELDFPPWSGNWGGGMGIRDENSREKNSREKKIPGVGILLLLVFFVGILGVLGRGFGVGSALGIWESAPDPSPGLFLESAGSSRGFGDDR